ncbi:bifunctional folylpolyglutamate synthase/dihydrofolate synthase [Patescibacteria group bacterium]
MEEIDPLYYNAIDQIFHAEWTAKKLVRHKILADAIKKLWPHGHQTKLIQVAGTSGKGSVCKFIEKGFSLNSSSGSLTGPHLFDYRERFSINNQTVNREDIVHAWENTIRPLAVDIAHERSEHALAFGEITLLIALLLFDKYQLEWGVIETGFGGRYDHATALQVVGTVLTNVGKDHERSLGKYSWQRALDKAGIVRQNIPLFTSVQETKLFSIINSICAHSHSPLFQSTTNDYNKIFNTLSKHKISDNVLLSAEHQLINAALAIQLIKYFNHDASDKKLIDSMITISMPGRLQKLNEGIYIDVAHNNDKISVLANEINKRFPDKKIVFLIGLSRNRSARDVLSPILPLADSLIITMPSQYGVSPNEIAQDLEEAGRTLPTEIIPDPQLAIQKLKSIKKPNEIGIITGSSFMIDEAVNPDEFVRYINATAGWRNDPK